MNWTALSLIAVLVLFLGVVAILAGGFYGATKAGFWVGFAKIVFNAALPNLEAAFLAYKASKTPAEWERLRNLGKKNSIPPGLGVTTGKVVHQKPPPQIKRKGIFSHVKR
jgi:hypothetical protein